MKYLWGIAFGIVCSILGVGLLLLAAGKPRGEPIQLSPPPTRAPRIVHVTGAVNQPGVYSLSPGARVDDAIEAAGGLTVDADSSMINLAMVVEDGMQIWVPAQVREEKSEGDQVMEVHAPTPEQSRSQININTATQIELESLSGIGPVIAKAIIQYRLDHGPFTEIEQIQEVSGIGPVTFEKIRQYITVTGPTGN